MLNDKLRVLLGKSSKYSNLFSNPDFQDWKSEIVDKRLEVLADKVLTSGPGSAKQIEYSYRYAELKYSYDDFFRLMSRTEEQLRKKQDLKEEV